MDVWLTETYFDWLRSDCFSDPHERNTYDGCLRLLHDIPFIWTIWSDENRAGDALAFRQSEFLGYQRDLDHMDQQWLANWASASPSVLEVLLAACRRWQFYFEGNISYYFNHLFANMGLNRYPGKNLSGQSKEMIRHRVDSWMSRQFEPNGVGSPFPLQHVHEFVNLENNETIRPDMREVDMWGQMNAYSREHFQ